MKKLKNISALLLCVSIVILSAFLIGNKDIANVMASAVTNYPTVEQYTNKDTLLKINGTDADKTIREFASEVKAASNGTRFDELAEVIPAQYLNSTEPNAVYQYNGKEYGFYVVKETVA